MSPASDKMSTTLNANPETSPPATEPEAVTPKLPDASVLVDQVPPQFQAPRTWAGFTLVLGAIYLLFCLKPIWHTDIWGHLSYGETVWQQGALPLEEPLLPLAQGMPFLDTAWLSQLLSYAVVMRLGLAGLQGLTGLAVAAACGFLLARTYSKTKSAVFSLTAVGILLWIDWNQFLVLRPQLFGLVCFVCLFSRLTGKPHRSDWGSLPVLMLVWANLHGSFVVGLGLLAAFVLGRAIDVFRRTGRWSAVIHDRTLCRAALIAECAAAATLINPYGLELSRAVLTFGSNPNLQSITEWQSLEFRTWTSGTVLGVLAGLAVLYRITPRRIAAWEPLTLFGLTAAAFWSARMLAWWAPVAAYLAMIHAHACWRAWRHDPLIPTSSPKAGLWTVAMIGLAWIFFGYSSLGLKVIHGKDPKLQHAVSEFTPVGAVAYLREHPPTGQVFNIYEWGDYLHWAGPDGMQIFVNSHAHAVPREVWQSYLQVIQMSSNWQDALDRYGVNAVVADRAVRENLIKALKDDDKWRVGYEDHVATVMIRRKAI